MFEQAYIDSKGVVRWKSNDNIPFEDKLQQFQDDGYITPHQRIVSNQKRTVETTRKLAEYREQMKNHVPDAEEMFEMRAAFGVGETVMNVITGQRYQI